VLAASGFDVLTPKLPPSVVYEMAMTAAIKEHDRAVRANHSSLRARLRLAARLSLLEA